MVQLSWGMRHWRNNCWRIRERLQVQRGPEISSFARAPSSFLQAKHDALTLRHRRTLKGFPRYFSPGDQFFSVLKQHDSTIYALSTAPGRSAIAIIRVSGSACLEVYQGLCPGKPPPKPRYATLRTLYDPASPPANTQVLDPNALVLFFPAPNTVTGEDVLELHLHGGAAVVKAVMQAIPKTLPPIVGNLQVLRYAEPGEFTRRAFYNGRLDLTQVEALGDTLSAETEQQRRLAVRGAANALSQEYDRCRHMLLHARGELEALIDFSEDQHFDESPKQLLHAVANRIEHLRKQLLTNIRNAFRGELLRNGISVALIGAPNAGKSSLLNRIVKREASIVSKQEGTTRDVVEVGVDIGGFYCRFGDLAGLRKSSIGRGNIGEVEMEGIRRAKAHARDSDLIVLVLSMEDILHGKHTFINAEVEESLRSYDSESQRLVCVVNKSDLDRKPTAPMPLISKIKQHPALERLGAKGALPLFVISCKEAKASQPDIQDPGGIQFLLDGLVHVFQGMTSPIHSGLVDSSVWEQSLGATERQRLLLQECSRHLESFLAEVRFPEDSSGYAQDRENEEDIDVVLAAEHLRSAADCLARITGNGEAGDVEEVLGVVFEKFCVGK